MTLNGTILHAHFQPYHVNLSLGGRPPHIVGGATSSGELLTRPQGHANKVEEFFSSLTIEDHFVILAWHLKLAHELHGATGVHTAINLHNSMIHEEPDRARLLELLRECTIPLTFEFTETYPMPPREVANKLLRSIRKLGHQTALDDFGTGLNGMSLLTDFDFDVIKIDRSLTFDISDRLEKKRVLAIILKMLEVLGRGHVVEGIEEVEVYEFLLNIGYTQFQGFHFDAPMPVADFLASERHHHEEDR
jgi:EAL domain-containing protein (putative c-di-GMP-specific phosphodiesterase class I)